MSVKEILIGYGLPEKYQPTINKIDFESLENFVSIIVSSMIKKYGETVVKKEIDRDNPNSVISGLITHFIEVGGIKIISDNNLETDDKTMLQFPVVVVSLSLNFAIANELKKYGVYDLDTYNYYDLNTLEILMSRLAIHVLSGNPNSREHFKNFASEMVKTNIFNKL